MTAFKPMRFGSPNTGTRYKGKCPECGRHVAVSPRGGRLLDHGPKDNRCPGSGNYPQQGRG